MKLFFSKREGYSVLQAKSRLKSVISRDRKNMLENSTMEKIRKDVTAVLIKYTGGNPRAVNVTVKQCSASYCSLEATVSVDTA